MSSHTSKTLKLLFEELSNEAYLVDRNSYNYKYANQVIRKHFEKLEQQNKELIEECLEFPEFLLQDYEMDSFHDTDELCWMLAGTEQKYSTKKIYEIWKELKTNKK